MITKQSRKRNIIVTFTYLVLDGADGKRAEEVELEDYKKTKCVFVCRPRTNKEAKDTTGEQALPLPQSNASLAVSGLASILVEPPIGFGDFPLSNAEFQARYKEQLADVPAGVEVAEAASQFGAVIDDRPLEERAIEYFGDPDMEQVAAHALGEYRRLTLPVEFFRDF